MTTDFEMFAGDTKSLTVPVKDDDDVDVDLGGATVRWQMALTKWKKQDPPEPILSKISSDSDEISISGSTFVVHLDPDDTVTLKGKFYHEASVVLSDGTVGTVLTGVVIIKQNLIKEHSP
jgi:hypothetical protein